MGIDTCSFRNLAKQNGKVTVRSQVLVRTLGHLYGNMVSSVTFILLLVGGWATPLKNIKVNWDDEIPNLWENKTDVPNHQPAFILLWSIYLVLHSGWLATLGPARTQPLAPPVVGIIYWYLLYTLGALHVASLCKHGKLMCDIGNVREMRVNIRHITL